MKSFLFTIIQVLIATQLLGQSFFSAEGKQIKTGTISKSYNFTYSFDDSLSLYFADSIIQFSNPEKTIEKTISYSSYTFNREPSINIGYSEASGRDSISKHFIGDSISMIYQTKYDNLGRVIYYGMKDFHADSTNDRGFEWFYEYRDSLISSGKIVIQTVFVDDAHGDKRFHFRVLIEYDNKNRKVKEANDNQKAQIITYTYNDKDSLISEKLEGMEMLSKNEKHINTKCDIETEYSFSGKDYNSVKQLVRQLLLDNKKLLTTDECVGYFLLLVSSDEQTKLRIVKRQPYWCEGRRAIFKTTNKL